MEDGIVLHYPDGSCISGSIEITDAELVFFEKNERGISMMFGGIGSLVGNALAKKEEIFNIRFDEIFEAKRKRFRLNKNAYYVTLKDGNTYIMIFDHPDSTIEYLESVISKEK